LVGDFRCFVGSLAPNTTSNCVENVSYSAPGNYSAWAQVDTNGQVSESNEGNNVLGHQLIVVAPLPDLIVLSIQTSPVSPFDGQSVTVTVTVRNVGSAPAAAPFYIEFYKHRDTAPGQGALGDFNCRPGSLAAGAIYICQGQVSYGTDGTYKMWAQVDRGFLLADEVDESNESNNILGPQNITVLLG
jgi:hypothetical protein